MNPVRIENNVPFFYTSQLEDWGLPDHYGFTNYMVIDDTTTKLVTDFTIEQSRKLRPIHRYNRTERFVNILGELMGYRGDIDDDTLDRIVSAGPVGPLSWESVRATLKQLGLVKYYNQIPNIMRRLYPKKQRLVTVDDAYMYEKIIDDFKEIERAFNENKTMTDRKYFPSLRFTAFKLLQRHGSTISVPLMRNKKTLAKMEDLWLLLELV